MTSKQVQEITFVTLGYDAKGTLDRLAKNGWELVSVCPQIQGNYCGHVAYFKRDKGT